MNFSLAAMRHAWTIVILLASLPAGYLFSQASVPTSHVEENPYFFIANRGQFPSQVSFQVELNGGRLYLENNRFTYDFYDNAGLHDRIFHQAENDPENDRIRCHAYRVNFVSANTREIVAGNRRLEKRNYYLGNDPSKWAADVGLYDDVHYKNLYPGIDLNFYGKDKSLKYDFVVQPGYSPDQIGLEFEGVDKLKLDEGNLIVQLSFRTVIEKKPFAYQEWNGQTREIPCCFVVEGNRLRLEFPEGFDETKPLIIDPTLVFSTYTGSTADNWGFTATYDDVGNHYGGGVVFGQGYPTTVGTYDASFNGGGRDISITKLNPTGTVRLYSTYIGGTNLENPHSLVVNSQQQLVMFGITLSSDFPMNLGFDQTQNGSDDIVLVRFDQNGANIRSTFVGGTGSDGSNIGPFFAQQSLLLNYGDNSRGEVIVDAQDNVYVASCTKSSNFPVLGSPSALQGSLAGLQDAVVFKMNPDLSNLMWSTYLGGTDDDAGFGLKLDKSNNVFVAGGTRSSNFPTTSGTLNTAALGSNDGFIARLNLVNSTIIASTYLGTSSIDQCYFLEIDSDEDVYVFGQTYSSAFPVTSGVYFNTGGKQFITKLNKNLTAVVFSTTIGSVNAAVPNISPTAFMVDNCEYLYISGWGGFVNFQGNTSGMPLTPATALQVAGDGSDLYFMVLEKDALSLDYGSYMGGLTTGEHVDGGTSRFDKKAVIYQSVCAGCGGSSAFPTTAGVVSTTNQSSNCNLAAIKIAFPLPGIKADFQIQPSTSGCAPFTVNFVNTSSILLGTSYSWDYGDGTTSSSFQNSHNYPTPGTYNVMLVVSDPNSCNPQDTIFKTITVFPSPAISVSPDTIVCAGQGVQLSATGGTSYLWTPATGLSNPNVANPIANPPANTVYQVVVTNVQGCKDSATVQVAVFLTAPVANAGNDTTICSGDTAQLKGTGVGTYQWLPGGTLSNATITNPLAFPSSNQTYSLTVTDANGCKDTDQVTVTVSTVNAVAGPDKAICIGQSTTLSGSGGGNYSWTPASGLNNPNIAVPTANPSISMTYHLLVTNGFGCTDTDSMILTVNPLPVINAGPDDTICFLESAQLSGTGGTSYVWNPGGMLGGIVTVVPGSTTKYILTGTDANNCSNQDSVVIMVLPLPPADAGPVIAICEDSIGMLAASGGVGYSWTPGTGLSDPGIPNPIASPNATTKYTVTVTGANGCTKDDSTTVVVIPTPVITISQGQQICLGESARLTAAGAPMLVWNTGDTATLIVVNPDTTTTYSVTGYDQGCPSLPQSVSVSVIDIFPVADFTAMPDSGWIPLGVQFINLSTGGVSYDWTIAKGIRSTEFEPFYLYTDSGHFKVILFVTNEYGCRDSTMRVIIVKGGFTIFVPNAFTPNGDGINDQFFLEEIGVDQFNIQIYDRWGQLLYQSDDKNFRWDGRFHSADVQEEVYTWVIDATSFMGHSVRTAGTVTVLR